ncbi:putative integral membrane protein [Leishmania donovani]|uniref:Putative integral membrane protein n=1 Tax=Leishmania donovani TaxID=5661 RepID=A0A504XJE1_LEIDO|nr:putative integral membrane protein [Leishmania donovani]
MSESTSSGDGTTLSNLSPLFQPSYGPAAHHSGCSFSAAEGDRDRDQTRRTSTRPTGNAAQFHAGGNSRVSYHTAEVLPLSPMAHAGEYMYAMDARKSPLSVSGTSLDSASLGDSQKHSYHPIEFVRSGTDNVDSLKSARPMRPLSVSTHPTAANVASFTPALSAKNSISVYPKEPAAKVPTSSSDFLTSPHPTVAPLHRHPFADKRSQSSNLPSQLDATPTEPPRTVRDASPSPLVESGADPPRFPEPLQSQPHVLPNSSVQAQKLSTPFSGTSHGVSRLSLVPAPPPSTLPVCDSPRSSEGDVLGFCSGKPPSIPLARTTHETQLALLASCGSNSSHSGGEGSKGNGTKGPASLTPFSSTTAPPRSGSGAHAPPKTQPLPPPPAPEAPPQDPPSLLPPPARTPDASPLAPSVAASSPSESISGHGEAQLPILVPALNAPPRPQLQPERPAAADLVHFAPLIQQFDFRKRDIKSIACTSVFSIADVNTVAVKLRLLRHEVLGRAEPIANIQQAAMRAGRVKTIASNNPKKQRASASAVAPPDVVPEPPDVVDVSDFHDTLAVFDSPTLAISYALWGSVAPYNDLVRALWEFCAPNRRPRSGGESRTRDGDDSALEAERQRADAVAAAAAPASTLVGNKTHIWVRFSSVLRFLNHCGIDVLIVSPDRKAATSFCAKRPHLHRSHRRPSAHVTHATPRRRVLVALSYDREQGLWCPLTTARPIRQVASQWREYQRSQRLQTRRRAGRGKHKAHAATTVQAKEDAVEARVQTCEQHPAPHPQQPQQSEPGGTGAAANKAPHVVVTVSGDSPSDGSKTPSLKSGKRPPFHAVLYPNLVQTDVGFTLLLRQGLHPLLRTVCVRLTVGVSLGCVAVLFGLALIVYATKTTDACLVDVRASQCVDVGSSGNSGGFASASDSSCLWILLSLFPPAYHAGLSNRYLYGPPAAPGKCLIVSICCSFAALLDNVLIVYFARLHVVPCAALAAGDAVLCTAHLESCSNRYAYGAHGPLSGTNVALVLACVYLAVCVLHWLVAALPVLPRIATQERIPTATPDTYTFRPSLFAPDGPTPIEVDQLRQAMQQPLRQELRHCVQARGRLLTTTTTIGEVMQANRVKSLKMTELNEERRRQRSRPFQLRSRDDDSGQRGRKAYRGERRRYVVVSAEGETVSSHHSSRSSSVSSSHLAGGDCSSSVVLAARLMQRVAEIGSRAQERGLPRTTVSPLGSDGTVLSHIPGEGQVSSLPVSHPSSCLVGPQEPSSRCPSATGARAVVVTDEESIVSKSGGDDLARQGGAPSLPVPLSSRLLASTNLVASPICASSARSGLGRPSASSTLTSKTPAHASRTASGESYRHPRGSYRARMTSVRSADVSAAVSPTVNVEIDRIVARVRARKDALIDGAT